MSNHLSRKIDSQDDDLPTNPYLDFPRKPRCRLQCDLTRHTNHSFNNSSIARRRHSMTCRNWKMEINVSVSNISAINSNESAAF